MSVDALGTGIPFWGVTQSLWLGENASEADVSKAWYVHAAVFLQITLALSGFVLFKWGMPAVKLVVRVATALFVDGDSNDEWEMTLRRSKEVKEQQKRANAEKEKERVAQKKLDRDRKRKKVNPPPQGRELWPTTRQHHNARREKLAGPPCASRALPGSPRR